MSVSDRLSPISSAPATRRCRRLRLAALGALALLATAPAWAGKWSINGVRDQINDRIGDINEPVKAPVARIGQTLPDAAPLIDQPASEVNATQIGKANSDLQRRVSTGWQRALGAE